MGIALLYWGLSCRQVAEFLRFSDIDKASHEAVRQWYHRAQKLLCDPSKRHRPTIAIDRRDEDQGRWREPTWCYSSSGRRSIRRIGNYSASLLRRRETVVMPPSRFIRCVLKTCTNEHADGARGRRMGRGIQRRCTDWACRGWERMTLRSGSGIRLSSAVV